MTQQSPGVQGPVVRAFQCTPRGDFSPSVEIMNNPRYPVCLYFQNPRSGERFDFTLTPEAVDWMREMFTNLWTGTATAELPVVQP